MRDRDGCTNNYFVDSYGNRHPITGWAYPAAEWTAAKAELYRNNPGLEIDASMVRGYLEYWRDRREREAAAELGPLTAAEKAVLHASRAEAIDREKRDRAAAEAPYDGPREGVSSAEYGRLLTRCCAELGSKQAALAHVGQRYWIRPDPAPHLYHMTPDQLAEASEAGPAVMAFVQKQMAECIGWKDETPATPTEPDTVSNASNATNSKGYEIPKRMLIAELAARPLEVLGAVMLSGSTLVLTDDKSGRDFDGAPGRSVLAVVPVAELDRLRGIERTAATIAEKLGQAAAVR